MSPFHYRKLQRVAHRQPMDAFPTLGVATREDPLCLATIEMEVLVDGVHVSGSKCEEVEQEIVDRMGGSYCVQRNHARVGLMHTVRLFLPFAVGLRLDRELRRIDEAVAPQTARTWPNVPHGAHGVCNSVVIVPAYFRTHLYYGNEVLVGQRIDHKPSSHRVSCQKDEVAIAQYLRDRMMGDIPGDGLQHSVNCHFARMANGYLGLELPHFDVDSGCPNHAREIATFNLVRIDED